MSSVPEMDHLQNEWKEMFQKTLPAKSLSQPKWPVHLGHCFARIILDATVGIDTPWMSKIKSPAYKNMTKEQLKSVIELGRKILDGEVDLVELNKRSLLLRGKGTGGSSKVDGKRKRELELTSKGDIGRIDHAVKRSKSSDPSTDAKKQHSSTSKSSDDKEDLTPWLKKIALSKKTSFQKNVLTALCQVPRGRYTTYSAISNHLSSSPRAVGNALRNNPFAPKVPCHRVLASSGGLGGFHGSWGRNGQDGLYDDKKRKLLRDEGVKFDGKGRVVGSPWESFI